MMGRETARCAPVARSSGARRGGQPSAQRPLQRSPSPSQPSGRARPERRVPCPHSARVWTPAHPPPHTAHHRHPPSAQRVLGVRRGLAIDGEAAEAPGHRRSPRTHSLLRPSRPAASISGPCSWRLTVVVPLKLVVGSSRRARRSIGSGEAPRRTQVSQSTGQPSPAPAARPCGGQILFDNRLASVTATRSATAMTTTPHSSGLNMLSRAHCSRAHDNRRRAAGRVRHHTRSPSKHIVHRAASAKLNAHRSQPTTWSKSAIG